MKGVVYDRRKRACCSEVGGLELNVAIEFCADMASQQLKPLGILIDKKKGISLGRTEFYPRAGYR
jgi:hypothetical protein